MKNLFGVVLACLLFTATPALAVTFGPAQPTAEKGQMTFGVGLFSYNADWESSQFTGDLGAKQTRYGVQLNRGLTDNWEIYLRAGTADLEVEDAFVTDDFEGDFKPFGTLGVKGLVHQGPMLNVGLFAEGSYFAQTDDKGTMTIGNTSQSVRIEFEDSWEANVGLSFEGEVEGAQLYGGPFLTAREGDVWSTITGKTDNFEEVDNLGLFAGVRWALKNGVQIDLEGQLRSGFSVGTAVYLPF